MSDLISRQAVIDIIHKEIERTTSFSEHETQINIEDAVNELPTAYDVDKVVEQLDKRICELAERNKICMDKGLYKDSDRFTEWMYEVIRCKDIVKAGGKSD